MPRTYPPRRTLTAIRLSPAGLAAIDTLAAAEGLNRSAMMRTLIGEALAAREALALPHNQPGKTRRTA